MKMRNRGTVSPRATGRIGLLCFLLFGVIVSLNPTICAQDVDVANAYTTAVGSALPAPDLPPDSYGAYTPHTPEPLSPTEGAALLRPATEGLPPMLGKHGAASILYHPIH